VRGALLLLAACGRFGFGPQGDAAGDTAGDGKQPDAPPDAPCAWSAFSTPTALPPAVQSAVDDWCPTPTADGLQLFMHTYRGGSFAQLWFAKRTSTTSAFGGAAQVTELTTGTSQQFNPTLTGDGLHLIYSDDKAGSFDLYEAVRATPASQFGTPVVLAALNDPTGTDWNGFVSSDGLRLMYTSNRTTGFDVIYETTRNAVGDAFGAPTVHGELTVASTNQWTPTLTADGLDIYFASTRTGGPGGFDIYTAHRANLDQPFGAATLVPALSSAMDDVCPRLTPDGTTMYMDYNANTSGGNADLMSATRSCN
jgi:Tol biopolymer transport system component